MNDVTEDEQGEEGQGRGVNGEIGETNSSMVRWKIEQEGSCSMKCSGWMGRLKPFGSMSASS